MAGLEPARSDLLVPVAAKPFEHKVRLGGRYCRRSGPRHYHRAACVDVHMGCLHHRTAALAATRLPDVSAVSGHRHAAVTLLGAFAMDRRHALRDRTQLAALHAAAQRHHALALDIFRIALGAPAGKCEKLNTLIYIQTDSDLQRAMQRLQCEQIGLDTEFVRRSTYYPMASLVQLAAAPDVFLIDIPALSDLSSLAALLTEPSIEKIVHSSRQDCEVLHHICGCRPAPLFDTQLAAAFLGLGTQIGYKHLVEKQTGVRLNKMQTNSDWLRRPLTQEQMDYAAEDVVYLEQLRMLLANELRAQNKNRWFEEESRHREQADYDFCSQFMDKEKHVSASHYATLKRLIEWREKQAQTKNLPRQWILSDRCIRRIVPLHKTAQHLTRQNLASRIRQTHGCERCGRRTETLAKLLQNSNRDAAPQPPSCPQPDKTIGKDLNFLKDALQQTACRYKISPALIATREQLTTIARSHGTENPLAGWRAEMMRASLAQLYAP